MSPDRRERAISDEGIVKVFDEDEGVLRLYLVAKGREHFGRFLQMAYGSNIPEIFLDAFMNVAGQVHSPMLSSPWNALAARPTNLAEVSRRLYGQGFRTGTEAIDAVNYGLAMSGIRWLRHNMRRRWTEQEVKQIIELPVFTVFDELSGVASEEKIEQQRRDSTSPAIRAINDFKLDLYAVCGALAAAEELVTRSHSILRRLFDFLSKAFPRHNRVVTLRELILARQGVETYFADPSKISRMTLLATPRGI